MLRGLCLPASVRFAPLPTAHPQAPCKVPAQEDDDVIGGELTIGPEALVRTRDVGARLSDEVECKEDDDVIRRQLPVRFAALVGASNVGQRTLAPKRPEQGFVPLGL